MRRKILKAGNSSLAVSIPMKWALTHNLSPGREIFLSERDDEIVISPSQGQRRAITLSLKDLPERMINRVVAACYKAGYADITLEYDRPSDLGIIQQTVERSYSAYDIEYGSGLVRITALNALDGTQLDAVERKYFQTISYMISELCRRLHQPRAGSMIEVTHIDKQIDMYSDFCRRAVNQGYGLADNRHCRYYFYEQLEIIADAYKRLATSVSELKKVPPSVISLVEESGALYETLYRLYYDFSLPGLTELHEQYEKLLRRIEKKAYDKESAQVLLEIHFVVITIFECKSALLTLRLR